MTGSFFDGAKGGKYDKQVQQENARMNFFRSSSGTRGDFLPSNPQLKSQPPARKESPVSQRRAPETQTEKTQRINSAVADFFTPKGMIGGGAGAMMSGRNPVGKPAATAQPPKKTGGLPADYKQTEQQAGQAAESHRAGAGFSPTLTGRDTPSPNGGSGAGTQTSPRQMTMDEANKLLTGGYTVQNPFTSNALPATSASAYAEKSTDVNYSRELPENMFIQEGDLKLTRNAYDAGSGVTYGQDLVQMPASGKIEYEQQAGAPLTVQSGGLKASQPNESAQQPEINKIPPRPRGERAGEMWDRQYGRMNQQAEREKSDLEKGYNPDIARRRAFLDAENSLQGLRRVEAQKGIVYAGQKHHMVNPNAGQEGESDFIAISKADRDSYMRGDQGAQDLKSKYVDKIVNAGSDITQPAPEGFVSPEQTPDTKINTENAADLSYQQAPEGYMDELDLKTNFNSKKNPFNM